jgi:hypothetical protein
VEHVTDYQDGKLSQEEHTLSVWAFQQPPHGYQP